MSYEFYKITHIFSLFLLVTSSLLIGGCVYSPAFQKFNELKKWLLSIHGIGALLSFVSGFGLAARVNQPLGIRLKNFDSFSLDGWNLLILFIFMILIAFIYRQSKSLPYKTSSILLIIYGTLALCDVFQYWIGYKLLFWILLVLSPSIIKNLYLESKDTLECPVLTFLYRYFLILSVVFAALFIATFKNTLLADAFFWFAFLVFIEYQYLIYMMKKRKTA